MMPGAIVAKRTRLGLKTARSFARFQTERAFNERRKATLMRYILATCFICAIGTPAVSAMPETSSRAALVGKADTVVEPVRHKLVSARHKRSRVPRNRSLGGIHPLVGSGDY